MVLRARARVCVCVCVCVCSCKIVLIGDFSKTLHGVMRVSLYIAMFTFGVFWRVRGLYCPNVSVFLACGPVNRHYFVWKLFKAIK